MKANKILDTAINIIFVLVLAYLFISGKHMLYVGIVKSWFTKVPSEQQIQWYTTYTVARIDAAEENKPMAVLITAPGWCAPCKAMEQTTLQNEKLTQLLNSSFIPVRILDTSTELSSFDANSFPTLILLSPEGGELKRKKGFIGVPEFISLLHSVKKN